MGKKTIEELFSMEPKDRIREPSNDEFYDEACGILIGFKAMLEERDGWMDIITIRKTIKEMKDMETPRYRKAMDKLKELNPQQYYELLDVLDKDK